MYRPWTRKDSAKHMIHQKRTSSFANAIGGLSILLLISSAWSTCGAQTLRVDDLCDLGNKMSESGDQFGAYIFTLSYYHLTPDSADKIHAGLVALGICLSEDRLVEAKRLVDLIATDFPDNEDLKNVLRYRYGHGLAFASKPDESDHYLGLVQDEPDYRDRVFFLKAYNRIVENRLDDASALLSQIDPSAFDYRDTVESIMKLLDRGPTYSKRYGIVAAGMSMCLPGLGQAYAGHYFDAIQGFAFNFLLGSAAYLSWKYEVIDRDGNERNYALPVISTTVWSLFYLANIWNAVNSANRYNRYNERQYCKSILNRFSIARTDTQYFLNFNQPIDL